MNLWLTRDARLAEERR